MKIFFSLLIMFSIWDSLYAKAVLEIESDIESVCETVAPEPVIDFDYELDAYYTNTSIFIDLDSNRECTNATYMEETKVYKTLFLNTFSPNIFLVEAAIHPMGLGGLYFREYHNNIYERTDVQDFNMIKALTAGFDEPYSFSFFLGRMMVFNRENGERLGKNRAYMGYLISVGGHSIKDNIAYDDKWVDFEIKLKGTRELEHRDLDWSFYVGTKIHDNKDFVNTVFVGARRSSTDFNMSPWSFVRNTAYSSKLSFSSDKLELTEVEFMIEKKWPLGSGKWSANFGLGYMYNGGNKYSGELKEEGIDKHQLLLRPNITF